VAYEIQNNIAWAKFNRPKKRNCMNLKLNRQMLRVLEALEFRDDVGVLMLSGKGTGSRELLWQRRSQNLYQALVLLQPRSITEK